MEIIKTKTLIIGSGPAGLSAAIYAARSSLDPILIQGLQPGGQLMITTDVENYPGFADVIQGPWLMQEMQKQAEKVGTQVVYDYVEKVDLAAAPFKAYTSSGNVYEAQTIIISTGAQAKWLGIESESKFQGYGVSGCATCDGFFFKNKEVVVVGGGNTAVEEAIYLTNHASKVYLVHRRNSLRAEKILQQRMFSNKKIEVDTYSLAASGACAVKFLSASTDITGSLTLAANGTIVNTDASIKTGIGEALSINLSASAVGGHLSYRLI